MGILLVLDIVQIPPLPNECQDFAADMSRASSLIGHDALDVIRSQYQDHTENPGQLVGTRTRAGRGLDAAQTADDLLLAVVRVRVMRMAPLVLSPSMTEGL